MWHRLLPLLFAAVQAQLGSKLTIQVEDSTLQDACFRSGCGRPKLLLKLAHSDSQLSIDWPINVQSLRLIPTPWSVLLPAALGNLSAAIAGTDTTYNFPRICDSTPHQDLLLRAGESRSYVLEGECFNVSVSVRRADCCPTCELATGCCDRNPIIITEDGAPVADYSGFSLESRVPMWVAVALGSLSLLLLLSVLLLLCCVGKRKKLATYSGTHLAHPKIHRSLSQESKYEVPWDHKFRPLPDYVRQLNSAHTSDRSSEGLD